jgi:hypothetical protein
MNYTYKDKLESLRAGDTLELEDGTRHEAVEDEPQPRNYFVCDICSLSFFPPCDPLLDDCPFSCSSFNFHFKKIEL